jgi:hypothetical protein
VKLSDFAALIVMAGSLALVIITLSGVTRVQALWIAGFSLLAQLFATALSKDSEE